MNFGGVGVFFSKPLKKFEVKSDVPELGITAGTPIQVSNYITVFKR